MISQLSTLPTIIKPSFREQQQSVASLIGKTFFLGYVEHVWVRGVVRGFMSSDRCTGHPSGGKWDDLFADPKTLMSRIWNSYPLSS